MHRVQARVAMLGALLAFTPAVHAGGPEPEAELQVPADYEPPLIDGVALYETPVRYTVRLEVKVAGREAIP